MTDKLEYIPPPKQKLKYIPPPNKNGLVKKPLITYFDKFKELEVSPKLKNNIKVKPIDEEHIKLDIYKPKITEEEEVKLKNDLKVKKFRKVKAEGVKEFLLLFGIKDRPIKETDNINYYQFRLKNQNPTTLMITNWRKELGEKPTPLELKIENAKNNVKLDPNYSKSDFIKAYKEKMGKKDYKDDIDKDYKSKEEALLSNPNIKDKGKKLEALRANKEKINKNIVEIKPVEDIQNIVKKKMVDKGIDFDFDDTHIEKKTKKPIKIVEDKGVNTDPIEETVKEIVKKSEDKSIDTKEFNKYLQEKSEEEFDKYLTEKSEEVFKKIKTKFEKEKEKDLEERRKFVKKLKEEQEKEDKDKEVKETIDDMIDKIEKEAKETKETKEASTDNETNIMQALNDGYKPKGNVSNKDYIHEMYQAENKFKHIIEKLKPYGDIERSNLNKESNEYFYQEIMPLLQKFNIDKEKLYNLFNKKPNHNLQYRNLTTLNNAIKKFLNEKLESLEKLDK